MISGTDSRIQLEGDGGDLRHLELQVEILQREVMCHKNKAPTVGTIHERNSRKHQKKVRGA